METRASQRLEDETKREKTDGKGRLKKTRPDSRAGLGDKICSKVYHYFVLVHRKTLRLRNGSRIRYPPANIILKPKFRAKLLFIISLQRAVSTRRGAARGTRGSNRTFFIQARRGQIIFLFSSPRTVSKVVE